MQRACKILRICIICSSSSRRCDGRRSVDPPRCPPSAALGGRSWRPHLLVADKWGQQYWDPCKNNEFSQNWGKRYALALLGR